MYPVLVERFLGPTGLMRKLVLSKPQASPFIFYHFKDTRIRLCHHYDDSNENK